MILGSVDRDRHHRNICQLFSKAQYLGDEILPAVGRISQDARAVFSRPIVMLKHSLWQLDSVLEGKHRRQQRRPPIRRRNVEIDIHTNSDADACCIALLAACVPTDFIDRQALIDIPVINREVPRNFAFTGVIAF